MYLLSNSREAGDENSLALVNHTHETTHPSTPALYAQLQAEARFGVQLTVRRLSELLIAYYGYCGVPHATEVVDINEVRSRLDVNVVFRDETLSRSGLINDIRRSIPLSVLKTSV